MAQARLIGVIAQNCPGVTIQIEGHSDPSGDPQVNLRLSQKRADSVLSRIAAAGIDTSNPDYSPRSVGGCGMRVIQCCLWAKARASRSRYRVL